MTKSARLRIAVQKSGRLNSDSMDLLQRCGLKIKPSKNSLLCHVENLPIDILYVRDNDIPTFVMDKVCDLGIVGENVLAEEILNQQINGSHKTVERVKPLGFSHCRLCIALPADTDYQGLHSLQNRRIATSYPLLLQDYLKRHQVKAEIMMMSGSVEIAPKLGMADAICDLVATGGTLEENNLKEVEQVIASQAILIKSNHVFEKVKQDIYQLLLGRMESVLKAQESKYIMFHAPQSSLSAIKEILPGCETPTIMPLEGMHDKVAVHVVSREGVFWVTLEKLKQAGASSILVLPIEKMLN